MQENFSLKPFNTFGVEAKAKYFAEVNTAEELIETLKHSHPQT
ncbi:UDP-N-acetylenolpyruvoylglucosamine reductase, partial [Chryseobacterium sp. 2TAF14]